MSFDPIASNGGIHLRDAHVDAPCPPHKSRKKNYINIAWTKDALQHSPPFDQERPFLHNSVCSQFLEGLFAILAECSQFCLRSF